MAIGLGLALLGGSLAGGFLGNKASKNAADAQSNSSSAAIGEQRRQFDTILNLTEPQRQLGNNASNALSDLFFGSPANSSKFGPQPVSPIPGPPSDRQFIALPQATTQPASPPKAQTATQTQTQTPLVRNVGAFRGPPVNLNSSGVPDFFDLQRGGLPIGRDGRSLVDHVGNTLVTNDPLIPVAAQPDFIPHPQTGVNSGSGQSGPVGSPLSGFFAPREFNPADPNTFTPSGGLTPQTLDLNTDTSNFGFNDPGARNLNLDTSANQFNFNDPGLSSVNLDQTAGQFNFNDPGLSPLSLDTQAGDFSFNRDDLLNDPGFQLRRDEALKSLSNFGTAQGRLLSGATGKAFQDRAAALASEEVNNAFNRQLSEFTTDEAARNAAAQRQLSQFGANQGALSNLFGREATGFGINAGERDALAQRQLAEFDANRAGVSDLFGREATGFGINASERDLAAQRQLQEFGANEESLNRFFGREATGFGLDEDAKSRAQQRLLSEFGANQSALSDLFGRELSTFGANETARDSALNRSLTQFNVDEGQRSDLFNRLAALMGAGQASSGQVVSSAQNTGNNIANLLQSQGNARAGGILGANQSNQDTISNLSTLGLLSQGGFFN